MIGYLYRMLVDTPKVGEIIIILIFTGECYFRMTILSCSRANACAASLQYFQEVHAISRPPEIPVPRPTFSLLDFGLLLVTFPLVSLFLRLLLYRRTLPHDPARKRARRNLRSYRRASTPACEPKAVSSSACTSPSRLIRLTIDDLRTPPLDFLLARCLFCLCLCLPLPSTADDEEAQEGEEQ